MSTEKKTSTLGNDAINVNKEENFAKRFGNDPRTVSSHALHGVSLYHVGSSAVSSMES